ncbi:hypothetical protein ACVNP1_07155 [Staphylococcus aureus]
MICPITEIKASIEQANQEAQEALKSYIDAQDDSKRRNRKRMLMVKFRKREATRYTRCSS